MTCPHCRVRLPNNIIISNQEASDALLADPDFQRRIRAVSFGIRIQNTWQPMGMVQNYVVRFLKIFFLFCFV